MKFNTFELGIFSFNSYVYYLTRGFIASTRDFNLLTRAFNLSTRAFSVPTRAFNLATRAFSLLTRGFELVTRGFELVTCVFEVVTCGFELLTRNSCFTFPLSLLNLIKKFILQFLRIECKKQQMHLIGENQPAAIKNRTILHTLSTIRDIIDVSNKLNKNLPVISSNFLKFFDRVDCDFIFSVSPKF